MCYTVCVDNFSAHMKAHTDSKQTKPDNVIIMTDDDIMDIDESVTVPGAVWLLFKGGQSKNLIDHIHGKKQTNIYNLD